MRLRKERNANPSWIKVRLPNGREFWDVKQLVEGKNLFTVCEEAHCPNRYECWNQGTATFMIAGERCTRACGFCATRTAKPGRWILKNRSTWRKPSCT